MFRFSNRLTASAFTSGTINGTSGSILNCEVLSITTAPTFAALGANSAETCAPGEERTISVPLKLKFAKSCTSRIDSSPNDTCLPADRSEARATTSSAGNPLSARILSISRPTLPVAPTTAIL